jgi:hypothetical protein
LAIFNLELTKAYILAQNVYMPSKVKKPKIRVEELEDVAEAVPSTEKPKKSETTEKVPSELPRVTSFSQLDSSAKTDEKGSDLKESVMPVIDTSEKPITSTPEVPDKAEEKDAEGAPEKTETEMDSSTDVKEWLKDIRPDTTKDVEKGGSGFNGKLFFGLLLLFILLGALAGGLFYYKQRVAPPTGNMEPKTSDVSNAPTATPTPVEKVDLTKYTVNVLNGSGTAGQAGVVKDLLVKSGFDAEKVKTANASTYDFKSTEVQVKVDVPAGIIDAIIKSLNTSYTVEVMEDNLTASSSYDVVVTVGSKK